MIAADLDLARAVANELADVADFTQLGPEAAALCTRLLETIADPEFPGALVPWLEGSKLSILVAAPTLTAWRRLSPVLRAFAGRTLTSFNGLPEALPSSAVALTRVQPATTSVMRLEADPRSRVVALRALERARETLARAPNLQRSAPEPTSWLVAHFQDHLNVGRRDAATEVLARLRSELRLDALNIKFLEVQLLAAFGDWLGLVSLPEFASMCLARRTSITTALLLEALYQVHVAGSFDAEDFDKIRACFEAAVRPLAQPMLVLPPPPSLRVGGWRLYALESLADPSRGDLAVTVVGQRDTLGWIADHLPSLASVEATAPAEQLEPLEEARAALVQVDAAETTDALSAVLAALEKLGPDDIDRLKAAEPFRSALRATEKATEDGLPTSWLEWLSMSADPAFTSALEQAKRGKDEWPIGPNASDPFAVQELVAALNRALGNVLATERTAQALPYIVAWLRRDPNFPQAGMATLYSSLLTLFAIGGARARVTYESSRVLVNALLSSGLDVDGYRSLIADIEELAGDGFGVDMTYWMLELIEDFMRAPAPDSEARQTFLHSALSRMSPIYGRLSRLQRVAVARLAGELGWTLQSFGIDGAQETADALGGRMERLRIAIYSLTETSSRQAKAAIEQVAPTAVVDCNADHGGSPRLRALAQSADLFVVTWLSAKHSATNFIREHRGDRPLIYAQGRGFSSILRTIDEYLSSHP